MDNSNTPQSKKTIDALWRLEKIILDSLNFNEVVQKICDSSLTELGYLKLGYEIVVLNLLDENKQNLYRTAISQTEKAKQALAQSPVPFKKIVIPTDYTDNLLIQSIMNNNSYVCTNWHDILAPVFSESESKKIQADLDIKASLIFPVVTKGKPIGALIFSMSKELLEVTQDEQDLIRSFSDIVGIAVQNATLYSNLESVTNQLSSANQELKRLDKIKDEFVFIATHELKNPVTAMRGYLSLFQEGAYGEIPEKMKEPLGQLQASNQQLVELVNDLLQIARSEAKTLTIRTEPTNLCPLINVVSQSLKPLADQKNLKIIHTCPNSIPQVNADPQRLKEIMNNLLSNAIKYSDKGDITITHQLETDRLITHIKDQGVGISGPDQKQLFTRFYRVEEQAAKGIPGTGLGLFIVKQLLEKMNGTIWVSSEKGVGSTFSFSLPTT